MFDNGNCIITSKHCKNATFYDDDYRKNPTAECLKCCHYFGNILTENIRKLYKPKRKRRNKLWLIVGKKNQGFFMKNHKL